MALDGNQGLLHLILMATEEELGLVEVPELDV
jgi:hypothetical protein